jgi:hypothetical protein
VAAAIGAAAAGTAVVPVAAAIGAAAVGTAVVPVAVVEVGNGSKKLGAVEISFFDLRQHAVRVPVST